MVSPDECLFCKIVRGEVPSVKVYEDEGVIAFLDINPAAEGHTLVVPKKHSGSIADTSEETLAKVAAVAKEMAKRIKENLDAEGVNILQNNGRSAGQIVDHFHVHVIPRGENDGIMLKFPRNVGAAEHLQATAKKLSAAAQQAKDEYVELREEKPEKRHASLAQKKKRDLDFEMEL